MIQDGSTLCTAYTIGARQTGRASFAVAIAFLLLGIAGCSQLSKSGEGSYSTVPKKPRDKAEAAKTLNAAGLGHMKAGDADEALDSFKESLAADVNYGPAHNNLGQLYLDRKQLYLAAWEFEFASKLMPQRAEPYINLGLVFEMAGQDANAQAQYEIALELAPGNVDALTSLARLLVKQDLDPMRVQFLLTQIVMLDDRPEWRRWAQDLLGIRYRLTPQSTQSPAALPSLGSGSELLLSSPQFQTPANFSAAEFPIKEVPIDSLPIPTTGPGSLQPGTPQGNAPPSGRPSPSDGPVIESPAIDFGGKLPGQPGAHAAGGASSVKTSNWESPKELQSIDLRGLPTVPASYAEDVE